MTTYQFSVIVPTGRMSDDQILDAADALGDAGCLDATVGGHKEGMELMFDRQAQSLEAAIGSAIAAVERAGFKVSRVELERECIHA